MKPLNVVVFGLFSALLSSAILPAFAQQDPSFLSGSCAPGTPPTVYNSWTGGGFIQYPVSVNSSGPYYYDRNGNIQFVSQSVVQGYEIMCTRRRAFVQNPPSYLR